jgi:hypothetical protein
MTAAEDMRDYDLTCKNSQCPQWVQGECGSPDPEVATGTPDGRLKPCPDRKVK